MKNEIMNASLLWSIFLTLSAQRCIAWAPMSQQRSTMSTWSKSSWRQLNSSSRLAIQQRSATSAEGKGKAKQALALPLVVNGKKKAAPLSNTKHQTPIPVNKLGDDESEKAVWSPELLTAGAIVGAIAIVATLSTANSFDLSSNEVVEMIQGAIQNPTVALENVVQTVESMGPLAPLYFGLAYTTAEVLAIPAFPLTASAGYLFGPVEGTAVVLMSASIAAAISFVIGRTLLRDYVEKVLEEYPKFAKLDRAIGKEGFKLMLLLRLSPIFPFALSNYLYGASSIKFPAFFIGTVLGFAPGTIAYVCSGAFGKALIDGGESSYPWFVYAGGLTLLVGVIKVLADTATRVVEEMEDDDDDVTSIRDAR